ncbi:MULTISPECIES: hypothetical protein [Bacteroides]|uniref:hypothetical protein n=1 Tax=Bacteroides TaxID=816 RepID=UPI001C3CC6BF|nr:MULTISPECIES: hypothetical protein [Bacteroides]
MELKIFYSWQSDLPKNQNLNFIETSIKDALKRLRQQKPISLDIKLDKATRNLAGSPDIAESIFSKIGNSSIFIADISIINKDYDGLRKTPNPNVLVELGYAARSLGWEKIICVYNTDFGNYNDLPFDLRNRRILDYTSKNGKDELSRKIESAICEMNKKGNLTNKILDFLKKDIDNEILGLLSHLLLIINDNSKQDLFAAIRGFLNMSQNDLYKELKDKRILGFYLLKLFNEYENKIYNHINKALSSPYYNREVLNSLIDIYEWFAEYDKFKRNYFSKLFIKSEEKDDRFIVVKGSEIASNNLPERYILMEKLDDEKGFVRNFGDFPIGYIPVLINYFSINDKSLDKYCDILFLLIKSINKWLEITNNEFIFDFTKQFRIKKTDGNWL